MKKTRTFKDLEVGDVVTYRCNHPLDHFEYEGHVVAVDEDHATVFIPKLIEYLYWDESTDILFEVCR